MNKRFKMSDLILFCDLSFQPLEIVDHIYIHIKMRLTFRIKCMSMKFVTIVETLFLK